MSDYKFTEEQFEHISGAMKKELERVMQLSPVSLRVPEADMLRPDLVGEIVKLSKRIDAIEEAKAFSESLFKTVTKRLNDIEKRQEAIDKAFLRVIELRGMKGNT